MRDARKIEGGEAATTVPNKTVVFPTITRCIIIKTSHCLANIVNSLRHGTGVGGTGHIDHGEAAATIPNKALEWTRTRGGNRRNTPRLGRHC